MPGLHARRFGSTAMLLVGALLVGNSFYVSVTTGAHDLVSVPVIGQLVIGLALIGVGYRYQLTADDIEPTPTERPDAAGQGSGGDDEFDPTLSPVGETLDHLDEDDEQTEPGERPEDSASSSQ